MKYTRPAPAPPVKSIGQQHQQQDQFSFMNDNGSASNLAKIKPPRPPPPKKPANSNDSKPSSKLFSNLFGASKKNSSNNNKSNEKITSSMEVKLPPPKLPPPPAQFHLKSSNQQNVSSSSSAVQQLSNNMQLINFDESPPASPVGFIKKSNTGSDSVSVDSFCSTNSSPNNMGMNSGAISQAESGFEDDFSVSDFKVSSSSSRATSRSTTFSSDPFECLDENFSSTASTPSIQYPMKSNMHANIRNIKPAVQPKPLNVGNTNFYSSTSASNTPANFDDSLSNGKTLIKPSTISMPTIIKPTLSSSSLSSSSTSNSRKPSPFQVPNISNNSNSNSNNHINIKMSTIPPTSTYNKLDASTSDDSFEDDPPSPPMPSIPPPILVIQNNAGNQIEEDDDQEKESYGIALYDFESDVTEDLSFRANEKIYLIQQMNDEWMYGRNKRGCEGIFPISYVDIKVPLKNPEIDSGTASLRSESVSPATANALGTSVRVLYTFVAEADGDLTIHENEVVNVLYEITSEWLYGVNVHGSSGQFPANFIEFVPHNLPPMPK